MSGHEFAVRAERLAEAFRARYGVSEMGAWTDEQIEQALADHGYPELATLPPEPRGIMVERRLGDQPAPLWSSDQQRQWRRVNAAHLLGHAILQHPDPRCDGCRDWGAP